MFRVATRSRRLSIVLLLLPLATAGCQRPARSEGPGGVPSDRFPGRKHRDAFVRLTEYFDQQIRENPTSAAAHAGAAEAHVTLWCFGFRSRDEALPPARRAARRALDLDPSLAAAERSRAIVALCDWKWSIAEEAFRRSLALDPGDPKTHHWYALYLAAMGRHDEAERESNSAVGLAPDSLGFKIGRSAVFYFARRFEAMKTILAEVIAQDNESAWAHDWLGMAHVQLREFDVALTTYERAVELADRTAEVLAGLGHAYGVAGRKESARKIFTELEEMARRWHVPPVQRAYVAVSLDERERAFELLEEAFREQAWELVFLREEPWFDPVREDARFVDLVERMQLPLRPQP